MDVVYSAGNRTLTLMRDYPHPIRKVWAAVSTPARIAEWMGVEWLGDEGAALHEGAHFDYRFANTDLDNRAHVLRFEPPHLLEHSWFENVPPPATVRWALEEVADGTRLTLTHFLPVFEEAPRAGAGWTILMEQLAATLDGGTPEALDWRALRDGYAAQFGPEATRDGRLAKHGNRQILTFDRILRHPPEKVWEALTTPAGIKRWWQAEAEVEPHVGGRFHLDFVLFDHSMTGEITAYDPPLRFGFTWPEIAAARDSNVMIEISPDPLGTHLRLIHDLPASVDATQFAAGWHWHLDGIDGAAHGVATKWDEKRWPVLQQLYQMTL
jgi:uncharacterized protein YndB with AHSA1/START domain